MGWDIVLLVVGLGIMALAVPVTGIVGAFVGGLFKEDLSIAGFVLGWIVGVLVALSGLLLVIFKVIAIVTLIVQQTHG